MTTELEGKARGYIKKLFSNIGVPLPDGWNDPEILRSLEITMVKLDYDLATKPEVRQLFGDNDTEKLN